MVTKALTNYNIKDSIMDLQLINNHDVQCSSTGIFVGGSGSAPPSTLALPSLTSRRSGLVARIIILRAYFPKSVRQINTSSSSKFFGLNLLLKKNLIGSLEWSSFYRARGTSPVSATCLVVWRG